jgi:tripartite ATP-independent transporter DctM subunit
MSEMRAVADDGLATASIRPLSKFGAALDAGLRVIMVLAVSGELAAIFMNVVSRYLFDSSFLWVDDVAKIALSIIAFIGGAFAYRRNEFVSVRAFVNQLPAGPRHVCDVAIEFIVLASAITAGVASGPLLLANWHELMPILQIPETWIDIPLTIGMAILAVSVIERLLVQDRRTVLLVGFFGLLVIGIAAATSRVWLPLITEDVALAAELIVFFALIVLGVPVGFALLNAALVFLCFSQPTPMVALPQNMVDGTTNFVLLAIPFFIFAGAIMEQGGLSRRFVRLVQAVVGHIRGGLLQVIVVSMYLVSGMSGSKAADVAAVGSVMRSMLRRQGYDMEEGTAVLAASAAMGETIPPSIAMLVLGSITTLSMASLFAAGLIPAAVLAVCLMVVVYIRARGSSRVPTQRASLQEMRRAAFAAILPLLMPAIIVVGVLGGIATPTEVSSFAVVYGLLLAMPLYREMDVRKLLDAAVDSTSTSGMILLILATATTFSWTLTIAYLPQRLVDLLTTVQATPWLFLIGSIALLIVLGSILEGLPALLILAPLLLPIASDMGISQLHFGIVLLIAMAIGAFAPPVGAGFYISCAVLGTTVERSSKAMVPYFIVLCIGVVLVGLVPWFTIVLPRAFGLIIR